MKILPLLALLGLGLGGSAAAQPAPPRFAFAPYFYTEQGVDLAGWARASGGRDLTLAFFNADKGACRGAWPTDEGKLLAAVAELRRMGGDVIISSGGWNADDLAARCETPEQLAEVYGAVLERFGADHLDLDPEPGDVHDNLKPEVVERRSAALALLHKRRAAAGKPLKLSFTIAVRPELGFDPANLAVLQSAVRHGVPVDVVNPMIMDYRDGTGAGQMGARSLMALDKAQAQLRTLFPERSDAEVWNMLSATPMLGQNDAPDEVFTLEDGRLLADYARRHGMRRLTYWSVARDNGDCPGAKEAKPACSGLEQPPHAFARMFIEAMKPQ